MPTYQYACTECGHQLEAVQSFSDEPLSECPACQGRLRKLFNSVGIVFKGSGFYRTDSRNGSGSSSAGKPESGKPAETKSETKSESKPAETKSSSDSKPAAAASSSTSSSSSTSATSA